MLIDAVCEVDVALSFEAGERREFGRECAERLIQVHNIVAANKNVFAASNEVHWHVYLVKPSQVIGGFRRPVGSQIERSRSMIKTTELWEGEGEGEEEEEEEQKQKQEEAEEHEGSEGGRQYQRSRIDPCCIS